MKVEELAQKLKRYRSAKGFSQEELAEKSGLSLRTVQRIENSETIPRGDSIQRLASTLGITPDDLMSWEVVEDRSFLIALNLSSLCFLFFPLLGILVPLIVWLSRKDKVQEVNRVAKAVLNFQITWGILFFVGISIAILVMAVSFDSLVGLPGDSISPTSVAAPIRAGLGSIELLISVFYLYNVVLILINSRRLSKGKMVKYVPAFAFMRV